MRNLFKEDRINWETNWFNSLTTALLATAGYFALFFKKTVPENTKFELENFIFWYMLVFTIFLLLANTYFFVADILSARKEHKNNKGRFKDPTDKTNTS